MEKIRLKIPDNCFQPQHDTKENKVYPTQVKFIYSNKPTTIYFGGFGSGKTESLIAKSIMESLIIPNNSGIIAAESYPVLRRGAMYKFFQQLDRLKIGRNTKLNFKYNKSDKIGFFNNGSRISFVHCQDADSLKGSDEGFIAIDELTSINYESYISLISRLRLHNRAKLFSASNTSTPTHWCYKKFIEGNEKEYEENNLINKKDYCIIRALTTENTNLPEVYKNIYNGFTEEDYQKYVLALWTTAEGLIYGSCFDPEENIIEDYELQQYKFRIKEFELMISIDPSYYNFAIGYYLVNRDTQEVIKIAEDKLEKMETAGVWKSIEAKLNILEDNWKIKLSNGFIDSANQQVRADLINISNHRLKLNNAFKDVEDGIITVRKLFNQRKLKILKSLTMTLADRNSYKYKLDKRSNQYTDEPDKKSYDPHHLDELRYLCHTLYGYKISGGNVEYQQFGKREG